MCSHRKINGGFTLQGREEDRQMHYEQCDAGNVSRLTCITDKAKGHIDPTNLCRFSKFKIRTVPPRFLGTLFRKAKTEILSLPSQNFTAQGSMAAAIKERL